MKELGIPLSEIRDLPNSEVQEFLFIISEIKKEEKKVYDKMEKESKRKVRTRR